jgi:DNA polymerase III epsilon subunit-like protein
MSIIVFDTETTGLLAVSAADLDYQPYLVELVAMKLNQNPEGVLVLVDKLHVRCKPPIPIPLEAVKVHNITDEMIKDEGPFSSVYLEIANFFLGCNMLVGHNLNYDKMVLWYELVRIGKQLNFPWSIRGVDTAEVSAQYYGHRKNLLDLYIHLFGVGFADAHSANADCARTMDCFIEMNRREMI